MPHSCPLHLHESEAHLQLVWTDRDTFPRPSGRAVSTVHAGQEQGSLPGAGPQPAGCLRLPVYLTSVQVGSRHTTEKAAADCRDSSLHPLEQIGVAFQRLGLLLENARCLGYSSLVRSLPAGNGTCLTQICPYFGLWVFVPASNNHSG